MPVGRWGERILLVDWLSERLVVSLWEAGCHSDPGTELEYRAGTALMMDLLGEEIIYETLLLFPSFVLMF